MLGSAQSALLTVMLPAELLPDANGALRTVQESLRLVGPLGGAALFVAIGAHAVALIDAASFAVPVLSLLALRAREPVPQAMALHWRRELTEGLRYVRCTVPLRQVVVAGAISTTVLGFAETITYAVAGEGLHKSPAFVGVLIAGQGTGAIVGGLSAVPLVRRLGEGRLAAGALLVSGAALCWRWRHCFSRSPPLSCCSAWPSPRSSSPCSVLSSGSRRPSYKAGRTPPRARLSTPLRPCRSPLVPRSSPLRVTGRFLSPCRRSWDLPHCTCSVTASSVIGHRASSPRLTLRPQVTGRGSGGAR